MRQTKSRPPGDDFKCKVQSGECRMRTLPSAFFTLHFNVVRFLGTVNAQDRTGCLSCCNVKARPNVNRFVNRLWNEFHKIPLHPISKCGLLCVHVRRMNTYFYSFLARRAQVTRIAMSCGDCFPPDLRPRPDLFSHYD